MKIISVVVATLLCAISPRVADAAPFLLDAAAEAQLESWLGAGNLDFSNVYEKTAGDTSADFHAAANDRGATFTLLQATAAGTTYVIGGYNPQSWHDGPGANLTPLDADRSAFIYNLTTAVLRRQKLTTDPDCGACGSVQTINDVDRGPSFGFGEDIFVHTDLTLGYETPYSYGPGLVPTAHGLIEGVGVTLVTIGALEVYTFKRADVPEPASAALFAAALCAFARARARRRSRS